MNASTPYTIRPVRADEWPQVKALRLAALQDPVAPLAFLETYEQALARPDVFWQDRAAGASHGTVARQFVAEAGDGSWAGTCVALVEEAGSEDFFGGAIEQRQAHLVGVYVRPGHRGRGLIERLFRAAVDWSFSLDGLERVRLYVHEENARAEAAYRKIGFERSGRVVPFKDDPSVSELEMELKRH
ncbi:GNAT family N-acetyltransferase [Streptomyces sp. T-3]|nr:GNAT family N-acetyltransferase [Streptomyces sp. T-3]